MNKEAILAEVKGRKQFVSGVGWIVRLSRIEEILNFLPEIKDVRRCKNCGSREKIVVCNGCHHADWLDRKEEKPDINISP